MARKMLRPSRPKMRAVRPSRGWSAPSRAACSRCSLRLSATILPKVMTQAPGSSIMEYSSIRFESIVGFSRGVAEFAPRKPPPLVPRCLMISKAAMGPMAIS